MRRLATVRETGNALVLVIVAIAALVAIAAPFALSMRLQERSARGFAARVKAEEAARAGRELAIQRLIAGTPTEERRAAEAAGNVASAGEDMDTLDELAVTATAVPGATELRLGDPKGVVVGVEVTDEQGKANLNSASALLLGNLLGVSTLDVDIDAKARELPIAGEAPFFTDGDRETIDGLLLVGRELLTYTHIERTIVKDAVVSVVSGVERGAFFSTPDPRDLVHRKGDLVHDARGWKLAEHPFWVELGGYRPYVRVSGAREIASWQLVDVTIANLFRRGVTIDDLAGYGLGGEMLRSLGAARTVERAAREAEALRALPPVTGGEPKRDAAARGVSGTAGAAATATAGVEGDDDEPARRGPEEPDAAAERLGKRLERGRGDPAQEGSSTVDDAMRRMGRKDGAAWLTKVLGAVGGGSSPAAKSFVSEARARMQQLADHERTYFASQGEQASRLQDARDLEVLSARELEERLRPCVTAASARPGEWAGGALVVNSLDFDPAAQTTTLVLGVDIPEAAAGLPCRIDAPGRPPIYRRVGGYGRGNARRAPRITVFPQLEGHHDAESLRVFVAPAHPVNVNTAPRRLLEAILTGLETSFMTQTAGAIRDFVTPSEAALVAARLVEAPIEDAQGLVRVLDAAVSAGEITGVDRLSILLNAIDPGHAALRARTLPFAFRGGEVAGIISTGIVNDAAGNEIARRTFRDVVSVSPPRGATVHFDGQADLFAGFTNEWLQAGQSLRAGRRANLVETLPVDLRRTNLLRGPHFWALASHAPGQGELRLASGEVGGEDGWSGNVAVRHFRDDPEGRKIEAGGGFAESSAPIVASVPPYVDVMTPGHFEMWVQPTWSDGYRVFFDTGPDTDERNRLALWYDPDTRELVLEASDTAFDAAEPAMMGRAPRSAEIRAPVRFEANRWVHVAACWRGTRAGDLALFVDGRSLGREAHVTVLSADIDATTMQIPVADGSIFPLRGVVRIGTELIDYDNAGGTWRDGPLGGNVLQATAMPQVDAQGQPLLDPNGQALLQRTSRTGRRPHSRGTPVQVGGYTDMLGVRPGDPRTGIPPLTARIPGGPVTMVEALPSPTPKARVYPQQDQRLVNGDLGILAGDTTIPVIGGTEPFPLQNGVIQIGVERIRYTQAVMVGGIVDQFTGCTRGFDGTTAADHLALENVILCDLPVAPGQQAFDQNNPLVQLSMPGGANVDPAPEWVAVRKPADGSTDRFYMDHGDTGGGVRIPVGIPWPAKAQYRVTPAHTQWLPQELSGARGQGGTTARAHTPGERVIGIFLTQWGFHGRLDWVTVVEANDPSTRVERRIAWASGGLAAFTDFVPKTYTFPTARLVKRPSGELPTWTSPAFSIGARRAGGAGSAMGGVCEGRVDEVRLARDDAAWGPGSNWSNASAYGMQVLTGVAPRWLGGAVAASGPTGAPLAVETRRVARTIVPPGAAGIAAALGQAGERTGLLVKLEDEVLGVGRGTAASIDFTERGLLGTTAAPHTAEVTPYVLPFPPVARLAGGFGGDRAQIVPASGVRGRALVGEGPGYLALDRGNGQGIAEMLPYDRPAGTTFERPRDDRRRGAYRGSFGTERDTPLSEGRLAIVHPFRHFDRHDPAIESDDATYWQASVAAPGAASGGGCLFEAIEWDEQRPTTEVGMALLVRIDGQPAWGTAPTNVPGGIFRFDDARRESRIDVPGRLLEVRVVFPFRPGAFQRGAWKETARLGGVRVLYSEGVRTIDSEDLLR